MLVAQTKQVQLRNTALVRYSVEMALAPGRLRGTASGAAGATASGTAAVNGRLALAPTRRPGLRGAVTVTASACGIG